MARHKKLDRRAAEANRKDGQGVDRPGSQQRSTDRTGRSASSPAQVTRENETAP